ncbi:MAG TPA: MBL fold metallo-hydrolase [Symbiobacteriaceae bacterium]
MKGLTRTLPIYNIPLPTPWPDLGPVHVYLVREDPVTLIDAGLNTPASREALLKGLRSAGVELRDIRRVLLTHAHIDHHGQAAWIQEQSGAEVWVHAEERAKLLEPEWWQQGRDQILADAGVPSETIRVIHRSWDQGRRLALPLSEWKPLTDGQSFPFERGELRVVHLPGHSLGHVAFWDEENGLLVGGDHLLTGMSPNPFMEPVPPGHPAGAPHAPGRALTLKQFLASLERLEQLPVRRVLPGHGPAIDDHLGVIRAYRAKHLRRLDATRREIGGGVTAYQLARAVYPRVPDSDFYMAVSQVLAHLDLLVATGRATVEPGRHGCIYRAA